MEVGAILRSADPGELPHGHRQNNDYLRKGNDGRRKEEAGGSYLISGFPILFLWKLGSSSLEIPLKQWRLPVFSVAYGGEHSIIVL